MIRWKLIISVLLICVFLFPLIGLSRRPTVEQGSTPPDSTKSKTSPKIIGVKKKLVKTAVKSVSPNKLKLIAGSKGSVVIKGQALGKVTGVQLLQKNRPAKGVNASLKGAAKEGSFKVYLSASKDAKPGSYQLKIFVGRKAITIASSMFSVQVTAPKILKVKVVGKGGMPDDGANGGVKRRRFGQATQAASPVTAALKLRVNGSAAQVKSASPKKLNLTSGAAAITVILKGRNLNRLTAAQVFRDNVPVGNVKASLQKSRNGMSRQVQLNALENAPAGNYSLRLLANGGQAVNLPERRLSIRVIPPSRAVAAMKINKMVSAAGVRLEKSAVTLDPNTLAQKHNEIKTAILKSKIQKYKMLPPAMRAMAVREIYSFVYTCPEGWHVEGYSSNSEIFIGSRKDIQCDPDN